MRSLRTSSRGRRTPAADLPASHDVATPRVTIGLPVYNGERHLRESVESILAQTFEDFELIISDNASTDGSGAIAREVAARDPRVRYHRHPRNLGGAYNHNWVVGQARGEYFRWASDDDIIEPTFLERMVEALDARPDAGLAFPRARIIDGDGAVVRDYDERIMRDDPRPRERLVSVMQERECSPGFGLMRTAVLRSERA